MPANKLKLVIFDMDGLMLDTEIIHYRSWIKYAKKYNFSYDIRKRDAYSGMTNEKVLDILSNETGRREDMKKMREEMLNYRENYFRSYTDSIKKNGLDQILKYLKENKIKACVASSSGRERIDFLLKKENIYDKIEYIISGEDVKNSKPSPDIFLKALLNEKKENSLIIEDSENGYKAAKKSGIPFIIIPDSSFSYNNLSCTNTYKDFNKVREMLVRNDNYLYDDFLSK